LIAMDAVDGRELNRVLFPGYAVTALAYDSDEGRLFVSAMPGATPRDAPLDLFVLRAADLEIIGHVAVPRSITCPDWCDLPVIAIGFDGVFVVRPGSIFEFDYLY
ncbi:MAG: hypothetical protein ACT443_11430, partial [Gemmatimonadota bacterium]